MRHMGWLIAIAVVAILVIKAGPGTRSAVLSPDAMKIMEMQAASKSLPVTVIADLM